MGLNFWHFLRKEGKYEKVTVEQMISATVELNIRVLAIKVCVNMIANAIGRCEFKTMQDGRETHGVEYYMLNVEPNINQNSTMFWHEAIAKLCMENEVLIVAVKHRDGHEMLVVADSWQQSAKNPKSMIQYSGVTVGDFVYDKTFRENEVIHLTMNNENIKPVLEKVYDAYLDLLNAAKKSYTRSKGIRLKVKVGNMADGDPEYEKNFKAIMDAQVKPWIEADNGVLPQFEGYEYSEMGTNKASETTQDFRALVNDIFSFTAKGYGIPPVLVNGEVADTQDAVTRWLTTGIDPLCDQIEEELNRKRYGYEQWAKGTRIHADSSAIMHFDMFKNAGNVEKLIGSGAFSINDVLAAAGRPEIDADWARKHWLTRNFEDINTAAVTVNDDQKGGN